MILDERNEFADNVAVQTNTSTTLIGDVIDLGSASRDIGNGETMYLVIKTGATEITTGGAAGTIKFQLASDAQAAIATDGTATVHFDTGNIVNDDAAANSALLNAGATIAQVAVPLGTYERYLGVLCTTATTAPNAGTIDAFLTKDPSAWKAYANAPGAAI